jgi:hypothetical protein
LEKRKSFHRLEKWQMGNVAESVGGKVKMVVGNFDRAGPLSFVFRGHIVVQISEHFIFSGCYFKGGPG